MLFSFHCHQNIASNAFGFIFEGSHSVHFCLDSVSSSVVEGLKKGLNVLFSSFVLNVGHKQKL